MNIRRDYRILWLVFLPIALAFLILVRIHVTGNQGTVFFWILVVSTGVLGFLEGYSVLRYSYHRLLAQRFNQCKRFCEAIRNAARSLELQEILDATTRIVVDVIGVKGCSIKLLDPKSGRMRIRSLTGIRKNIPISMLDVSDNVYNKALRAGESVIVKDVLMKDFPEVNDEIESLICVPIGVREKILGAVCVYEQKGKKLSQEMTSFLSNLANVVSLSIAHVSIYENLKSLVDTKTWFMLQTSHELRSPLNAIRSIAMTLLGGYVGELDEKKREMISRIDLRTHMLSELVDDLLSLAKGRNELSILKPTIINVYELLQESVKLFETEAKEKRIDIEIKTQTRESQVYGSKEELLSVFTNLLSNSIKYSSEGGNVVIRLFERDKNIAIEVSDTGIGIPKNEQDRLFSEFFRASNAKAVSEMGTGLGLAIVKAKVEQHGGSIEVESEEGKGATFRIFLNKIGFSG
jgi:signal transduction histidine kinase